MSLKRKFIISSVLMFVVPLLLILLLTAAVFAVSFLSNGADFKSFFGIQIHDIQYDPDQSFSGTTVVWVLLAVAIVTGTSSFVVLGLSRSILTPLSELKSAAENIKVGNLDFEVLNSNVDEVSDLCRAFEDMRIRLRNSVNDRLVYERERNIFLANISHDLRTPITSIKGYVEGIADGVADTPEKLDRYLATIKAKANSLERLVEQMSDFSELELGRVNFHFEYVDFLEFLKMVVDDHRLDIEQSGAILTVNLPEQEVEPIFMDPGRMQRVFGNIIGNALKYRADRPLEIGITAARTDGGVQVSISDNGCGIPNTEINRVFDGFYRGDPARTGGTHGHGLGLSISKQIVERHRGKIWLKSEEDTGTVVHLYLPLADQGGKNFEGINN